MILNQIRYENYRNIEQAQLFLSEGVNILWGANAQGKTNALEGMHYFASGKSFRGVRDKEVILFERDHASLEIKYQDSRRQNEMKLRFFCGKNKQMEKNGVSVKKAADFVGNFHSVLFCPEHLMLVQGAPLQRRAFLDSAICQLKPSYVNSLTAYHRILKQRNALLKEEYPMKNKGLIEVLTMQMASVNTHIVVTRQHYVEQLQRHLQVFVRDMTQEKEKAQIVYRSDVLKIGENAYEMSEDKEKLSERFYQHAMETLQRDVAAKTTLVGCHKDDLGIYLNSRDAKKYTSQGQDRSLALALKLGEGEMCRAATGEYPVFLFDDVLSELDRKRQNYLMEHLKERQVIMTCCNEDWFQNSEVNMIYVENGTYREEI